MSACKHNPAVHCMCDDGFNCNQKPEALRLANVLDNEVIPENSNREAAAELRRLHAMTERTLTDEVIADLWHQNGGFHHHFARAVERWLRGEK